MQVARVKHNVTSMNNQPKRINKTYLSSPMPMKKMKTDSVSFGSNRDDEIEKMAKANRKKYTGIGWVTGGRQKELNKAKNILDRQDAKKNIDLAVQRTTIEENQRHLQEMKDALLTVQVNSQRKDAIFAAAEKAHEATIQKQGEYLAATQQIANQRKELIDKYEELLNEQKQAKLEHDNKIKELLKQQLEAEKKNDIETKRKLDELAKNLNEMYEKRLKDLASEMKTVSNTEAILSNIADISNKDGFGKIAGYELEKEILTNKLGTPIGIERGKKVNNVPDGILFFGPKGCGKSTFAEAFATQLGCRHVKVVDTLDPAQNLEDLRNIAINAQEKYENDGIRTIIQIDEFEDFVPKGSKLTQGLQQFMDTVSQDYHCTIFATTNFPENISPILLRDGRFVEKVGLPYADKYNAKTVLMHYGKECADESVDFDELANLIVKPQPEAAFSNDRIKSVFTDFIQTHSDKLKMSHNDFKTSIEKVGTDISKKAIELFKTQLEYVKHV